MIVPKFLHCVSLYIADQFWFTLCNNFMGIIGAVKRIIIGKMKRILGKTFKNKRIE